MLMEFWERYRRVILPLAIAGFLALSAYLYNQSTPFEPLGATLSAPPYASLPSGAENAPTEPGSAKKPDTRQEQASPSGHASQPVHAGTSVPTDPFVQTNSLEQTNPDHPANSVAQTGPSVGAGPTRQTNANSAEATLFVDVKGQVVRPGVYRFAENDRIASVIEQAGGFLPDADADRINLAQPLADGMLIFVPTKGEEPPQPVHVSSPVQTGAIQESSPQSPGKINLNNATAEQLTTLPGIGLARAQSILQYRQRNGPFQTIDQLGEIPGIGAKILERIRDKLIVE